jgi:hypothetical protein
MAVSTGWIGCRYEMMFLLQRHDSDPDSDGGRRTLEQQVVEQHAFHSVG